MKKIILFFIFFSYLFFAGKFNFKFSTTSTNYFNYLAEAFLHCKLYLESRPSHIIDLIPFNNKLFLYWPPVPAIILLPFISIFGKNFSDILYTSFVGGLNCAIFYYLLDELKKTKIIIINNKAQFLATLFFAFGTVHFYISLFGRVWFTEQIFSLFFFLIALWQMLKFLNNSPKRHFYISSLAFSLAVYSRNTFFFSIPFFLGLIYLKTLKQKEEGKYIEELVSFLSFFLFLSLFNLFYNFARFGSFLENGVKYHLRNPHFDRLYGKYGFFNLRYLPINFYFNFLNPLNFQFNFPFIKPNPEGNSIFFTSPLFLYLFKLNKNIFANKVKKIFNLSIIISILLMLNPSLFLFGTGWFQFGARYLLDIIPFLIVLTLQATKNFKSKLSLTLLGISCFINIMAYFWWKSLNI